jgi:predicted dehydrogenase
MPVKSRINRREFIRQSTATGAAAMTGLRTRTEAGTRASSQASPNARINLGFIGAGARAQQLMQELQQIDGVEIVALCDAYRGRLERAAERAGKTAKVYRDANEVLAQRNVDAVFVVTPDHLHKSQVLAALVAGKDVYCEKPMTYTIDEGREIIEAVKKSERVLQVGSQGVSSAIQARAREIVMSGKLGQVTMIRATFARNSAGGAWIYPIPPDASRETVNWEMFLGPAPKREFSLERFFRWRCYEDYSGGVATDLFVHLITTIHFIMSAAMPATVVALGSLDRWKETRDVPDTLNAVLQYPEGFTLNLSATLNNEYESEGGVQILGTKGTLQLGDELRLIPDHTVDDNGWVVDSWPRALQEAYIKDPKVQEKEMPRRWPPQVISGAESWLPRGRNSTYTHIENFLRSVRTRQTPIEDAVAGHHAASVAHMINIAARGKKAVFWDKNADRMRA